MMKNENDEEYESLKISTSLPKEHFEQKKPKRHYRKYGNLYTFLYVKGEPVFAVGPDYIYFALMFIINICLEVFLMKNFYRKVYTSTFVLGIFWNGFQLLAYFLTATLNPGLPRADYAERVKDPTQKSNYKKCKDCGLWINCHKSTYHCLDCGVCIEGFDHHCPWMTKCIGRRTKVLFYVFITLTFSLFIYYIFAIGIMGSYMRKEMGNKI